MSEHREPPRPDQPDLRLMARMVKDLHSGLPFITEAIKNHGKAIGDLQRWRHEVEGHLPIARGPVTSLSEYDPDRTPHGGIRIDDTMWQKLQVKIQKQEDEAAEREAREKGAAETLAALEKKSDKFRNMVLFWMALLVPVASSIGWLANHFLERR